VSSGSGGSETDSGVPAGDQESVRGRHGTVKARRGPKGPRRVRILDAAKASVQWCAGSRSAEADAANSFIDPPLSWPRDRSGLQVKAPGSDATMSEVSDGSLRTVQRGGHRAATGR
jgi:hypothetical protein